MARPHSLFDRGQVAGRAVRSLVLLLVAAFGACGGSPLGPTAQKGSGALPAPRIPVLKDLTDAMRAVMPLHKRLGPPRPGDWLDSFEEPGQTFAEYLGSDPVTPLGERRVLYVQPIGAFGERQRRVLGLTADFLGRYFNLQVVTLDEIPLDQIPSSARRVHRQWKIEQINTEYITGTVLLPRLPEDAAACIALTTVDLWPGDSSNFVFGQASLRGRVGVWSLYRFGDPDESDEAFRLYLLRALKTATHETGHMFSILHCTKYECNMCGCNSLTESDRYPLDLCPECMAKVCWATAIEPAERYRKLAAFCEVEGLAEERRFYEQSLQLLELQAGMKE